MTSANMHAHHVYNSLVILIEACTRLIYCSIFNAAVCECFHRSHSLWGLQTHPTLHSTWVVLRVHSHMRSMKSKACMASVLSGQLYPWENMILWSRRNCFREGGQARCGCGATRLASFTPFDTEAGCWGRMLRQHEPWPAEQTNQALRHSAALWIEVAAVWLCSAY